MEAEFIEEVSRIPGYQAGAAEAYLKAMREIPDELAGLGVWAAARGNPFYVPHQASELVADLTQAGLTHRDLAKSLKDRFAVGRQHETKEEFVEALQKIATKNGVAYKDPTGATDLKQLMELDIGVLVRERLVAMARTSEKANLKTHATRLGMKTIKSKGTGFEAAQGVMGEYLRHQFAPIADRTSVLQKLLGGGEFHLPITHQSVLQKMSDKLKVKHTADGEKVLAWKFPGVNSIWKPLLTSFPTNVAFHSRNWISAVFMSLFDPQIGFQGFKPLVESMEHTFMVGLLGKRGYKGNEIAHAMTAMKGDSAVRFLARAREDLLNGVGSQATVKHYEELVHEAVYATEQLKNLPGVGGHSWEDLLKYYKEADLGMGRHSIEDLMGSATEITDPGSFKSLWGSQQFGDATAGMKALLSFKQIVKAGTRFANYTEDLHRFQAFNRMLEKGVNPYVAIDRMQKAFVNYNVNSTVERWLRDIVPFARFSLGSGGWAKQIAQRPFGTGLTTLAQIQHTAQNLAETTGSFLPPQAQGGLAMPIPWKDEEGNMTFLTGLGLPQEVVVNMMGVATLQPMAIRKNVLGGLHPALKLPAEAVTGRNFYFGTDFGTYRRGLLGGRVGTDEIVLPDGTVRKEVPGIINEWGSAMPWARQMGIVNKLVDNREQHWGKLLLQLGTGVRMQSVNEKRELKRRLLSYLQAAEKRGQVRQLDRFFSRLKPEDMPENLKIALNTMNTMGRRKKKGKDSLTRGGVRPGGF